MIQLGVGAVNIISLDMEWDYFYLKDYIIK